MAEWSKALVLGTSYFGSAGSNPAPVMFYYGLRGISSIGRVRRSQRRGTGIETRILHIGSFYHPSLAKANAGSFGVGLGGSDGRGCQ